MFSLVPSLWFSTNVKDAFGAKDVKPTISMLSSCCKSPVIAIAATISGEATKADYSFIISTSI
jgi:hypothetical protein